MEKNWLLGTLLAIFWFNIPENDTTYGPKMLKNDKFGVSSRLKFGRLLTGQAVHEWEAKLCW